MVFIIYNFDNALHSKYIDRKNQGRGEDLSGKGGKFSPALF